MFFAEYSNMDLEKSKLFLLIRQSTLFPTYKEFGYNEQPAMTIKFLCIKIIDINVKKFDNNEIPLTMSDLHFNHCKLDPVYEIEL